MATTAVQTVPGLRLRPYAGEPDLADLDARLPVLQRRALWQNDLGDHGAHDLLFEGLLGDVGRQPAGIVHHEPHQVRPITQWICRRAVDL